MNVTPLPPQAPRARSGGGRGVRSFLPLLVLLLLPACATKGDIAELTSAVEGLRAQSARTDSVLMELAADIDRLQDTVRTAQGEQVDTRGSMARDLRRINEQLTRIEQLVGVIQADMTRFEDRVVNRLSASLQQLPTSERPDTLRGQSLRGTDPGPQTTQGGDPDAVFDVALRQYRNQALMTARAGFTQFLNMAPNHPRAPEAWFYMGDIHEQEEELDDAVAAFLRVHELFPGSDQVPMALYRAGALEHERGNDDAARDHLQRLVNSFPDADAAQLARELLREIG